MGKPKLTFDEHLKLRQDITNLSIDILNDVEQGECFYDLDMFNTFQKNVDLMKELSSRYFQSNQNLD